MIQSLKSKNLIRKTKTWLKNYFIQEVPPSLSPCEFDCHRTNCTYGSAEKCKKRKFLTPSESSDLN